MDSIKKQYADALNAQKKWYDANRSFGSEDMYGVLDGVYDIDEIAKLFPRDGYKKSEKMVALLAEIEKDEGPLFG